MVEVRKEDLVNPIYLRNAGISVLQENLGIVGAIRFMQQLAPGYGDYTKERRVSLGNETIEDFEATLAALKGNM